MKKTKILIVIAILITMLLVSCSPPPSTEIGEEKPNLMRGGEELGGINLKNIDVQVNGDNTDIILSFINGSRIAGVSESKITSVPKFDVTMLDAPTRLKVDLAVDFWDYTENKNFGTNSIVIDAINTINSNSSDISVYFQLKDDAEINVSENQDKITISLKNKNTPSQKKFFTGINAYEEYEQGLIDKNFDLNPTLCEGLTQKILISPPFDDEKQAQIFCDNVNELIGSTIPTKKAYVFQMDTKQLPGYNQEINNLSVNEKKVMLIDDTNVDLPVLVENGRYLTTMPDENIIYARSYLPNYASDNEQVVKERLWIIEKSGRKTELDLPDFYSVEKCQASYDGRYLAILDSGIVNKVLYIYDTTDKVLYNMGEEGFGDLTASFAWAQDKNVIYAMSGNNSVQLMQCDFSKLNNERISSVEEKQGALSNIDISENTIYFADSIASEGGEIFSVDILTHQRELVVTGINFVVSNNGKYLGVLNQKADDEQQVIFDLQLYNIETKEQKIIAENLLVEDYCFGADDDTLYYMTPTYEGVSESYPFALVKYSLSKDASTLIGYCSTGKFEASNKIGELYIIDYFSQDNSNFYITYIYNEE